MKPRFNNQNYVQWTFVQIFILSIGYVCLIYSQYGIFDTHDTAKYIASGISLIEEFQPSPSLAKYSDFSITSVGSNLDYPSPLFQVISASLSGSIGSVPSIPMFYLFTVALYLLGNLILFSVIRRKLQEDASVVLMVVFFLLPLSFFDSYNQIRPLTGSWMLVIWYSSLYFSFKGKGSLSGVLSGVALALRLQAYQLIFLQPFFIGTKVKKRVYFLSGLASYISIYLVFKYALGYSTSGASYYTEWFDKMNINHINQSLIQSAKLIPNFSVFYIFSAVIWLISRFRFVSSETKKIANYTLFLLIVIFFFSTFAMKFVIDVVSPSRYYMYLTPLLMISSGYILADYFTRNQINFKVVISIKYFVIIAFVVKLLFIIPNSHGNHRVVNSIYQVSLLNIPAEAVVATNDYYVPDYLYSTSRVRSYVEIPQYKKFVEGDHNLSIDYLIFSRRHAAFLEKIHSYNQFLDNQSVISDKNGITFEFYSILTSPLNMIIYKRIKQ